MQRSLFSAVSGLRNHQTAMDVIGNNIANVNTTAFKAGRATFKESFSQILTGASRPTDSSGGVNPVEVGLGMQLASVDTVFTQGNLENTGVTTDMAVQGNSFFVVKNGSSINYTRAGNFQPDATGKLVSPTNGSVLQGRMAANGVLNDALTDITIPQGQTTPAKATTRVTMSGNFDSSANVITAANLNDPTDAELADPANAHSVTHMTIPSGVYDSLGQTHDLTLIAWKVSPTQWDFKVDPTNVNYDNTKAYSFGPGAQSSPAAATAPWQFTFNTDGTINTASSNIPQVSFTPPGNGNAMTMTLDPGSGANGLTSFVGGTSAVLKDQDGYSAGVMTGFTIGQDGTIVGSFSNGTNETLGQVALADFNNPEGLEQVGDNMYTISANSGSPVIGYSGRETSSTIASGSLEMSNVDLAQEFTNMIITERGFQANGKMITTSDEMLQTLIGLRQ